MKEEGSFKVVFIVSFLKVLRTLKAPEVKVLNKIIFTKEIVVIIPRKITELSKINKSQRILIKSKLKIDVVPLRRFIHVFSV